MSGRTPSAVAARARGPLEVRERAIVHSLTWLVAGCVVGWLMALLLAWPPLGRLLVPLTYGRWATLHLDLLLYGWSALPLVGLLLHGTGAAEARPRLALSALTAWSGALALGSLEWLSGHTSGRLFVEWRGVARVAFGAALAWLWIVLAASVPLRRPTNRAEWGRLALVATLGAVPWAFWSGTASGYQPPINPSTGGATGAGLLGSSLGLIAVLLLTPLLLGVHRRGPFRAARFLAPALAAHAALFTVARGDHSHREPLQVVALVSLVVWVPLLVGWWRSFQWPTPAGRWLASFGVWGGLLASSSVLPYLAPDLLDAWKFTHSLVAHAHLAMAGVVSSYLAVILVVLGRGTRLSRPLTGRRPFLFWHAGCLLHLASVSILGALEVGSPGVVFQPGPLVLSLLWTRWLAGGGMLLAAVEWLLGALRAELGGLGAGRRGPMDRSLWEAA